MSLMIPYEDDIIEEFENSISEMGKVAEDFKKYKLELVKKIIENADLSIYIDNNKLTFVIGFLPEDIHSPIDISKETDYTDIYISEN